MKQTFEFVCDVMPVATGARAELLCAAVLAQSNHAFDNISTKIRPMKLILTVHVADELGAEASLKLHDAAGNTRETARLGITTSDRMTPAQHSERLAAKLLDGVI